MVFHRTYETALITGATSGIGQAFAEALPAETGLLLTGRNEERLQATAARLARPGRRIDTLVADLVTVAGREAVIGRAEADGIDLFICNAGTGTYGPFLSHAASQELASLELNVVTCVQLLHALLPGMLSRARARRKRAGVVVVSSRAAYGPVAEFATYAASKAFQLRLTQALAKELKNEPVDVLALCPGYTRTNFFARSGAPKPPRAMMPASAVAQGGLAALGRHAVHLFGTRGHIVALLSTLLS